MRRRAYFRINRDLRCLSWRRCHPAKELQVTKILRDYVDCLPSITRFALGMALAAIYGCSVTGIGAEGRTHREQATLHKVLDGQRSYSAVVQIMSNRSGYSCNDSRADFLVDQTGNKLNPPKPGKHLVCNRNMDWNVTPLGCSWKILLNACAIETDTVFDLSIDSYKACI